jgi:thiosulfate dehydrogenase [quinone] large subunit
MSAITARTRTGAEVRITQDGATQETRGAVAARYVAAATRISLGWVFLWAFLDKTFGLGFATKAGKGWIDGGHPTEGFLTHAAKGPFKGFFNDLAGYAVVDWLFMVGLLGIGVALILGIGMRIAAVSGVTMLTLMWAAELQPANNPFMDDHIVYGLVLVFLALSYAGRTLGLGRRWERLAIVQRLPFLK